MGIESVVDENSGRSSGGSRDAMCSACEMAVVWMQNQIRKNQTEEQIINYVNQLCERLPSPMGESVVDCDKLSSLPNVSFTIGGKAFDLSAEENSMKIGNIRGATAHLSSPLILNINDSFIGRKRRTIDNGHPLPCHII
ncbi:hypothetical protein CRG98_025259 [Punica granatum]|uniref:Saposin B-type domain-containing protein n=1 Tax=Punica granatum TaxID=22663 RepID=A0A2I0JEE1_PUNGR|nr:hypothetical protein CRG98_025259 [Punica granatum]